MSESEKPIEEKDIIDEEDPDPDFEFTETTVKDLMDDKIKPRDYYPYEQFRVNMSWTQLIAMLNKKMSKGEKINTQVNPYKLLRLYMKCTSKSFL